MIFSGHPELIVGAQHGAPLAVGFGEDEMFVGSDGLALAPLTQRIAYLNDGDWTVVDRKGARFFDADGAEVQREVKLTRLTGSAIGKGNFRHFMEKELHEHPGGDRRHAAPHGQSRRRARWRCPTLPFDFATLPRITISACGSAFYAGLVGRWWFEAIARIPTDADVASEFRYRTPPLAQGGLGHPGQPVGRDRRYHGGAALHARAGAARAVDRQRAGEQHGARIATRCWRRWPGPEISVASTKAFTAQLSVLACLAIAAGARARRDLAPRRRRR